MRVVLGVGGSEDGLAAVRDTIARVGRTGDELTIAILENPASDRSPEAVESAVEQALQDGGVDATVVRLDGDPGPALTEFAAAEDYDHIVLGGGRRSPMGKIAIGQIAEFVILNADRTVTLVR